MKQRRIVLIVHNIRSAHNVGSLMRTADGLKVQKIYLSGYSPYPKLTEDSRLPHVAKRAHEQITKTALGAENSLAWSHEDDLSKLLKSLKKAGLLLAALEQTSTSNSLPTFNTAENVALIVGNEVDGLEPELLRRVDVHLQIPMLGSKESFNVAIAAAIALYHLRYVA